MDPKGGGKLENEYHGLNVNVKFRMSADRCGAAIVGEECCQRVLTKLASGTKNILQKAL